MPRVFKQPTDRERPSTQRRSWRGSFSRFLRDRRGATYVVVAILSIPLIGFLGLSADGGRAYLIKARLSTSVDAAALAGAKNAWNGAYGDDVTKYFNSNFPPGYLGATPIGPTYSRTTTADGYEVVKVSASAAMPTSFMHLFGVDTITVSAESEATRKTVAMDVVLSMDMSGSMASWVNGTQKIAAARDAAKTLVNILYGSQETNSLLKVGLVPWNGNVNVLLDISGSKPISEWDPSLTTKKSVAAFTNPIDGQVQDYVWQINNSPVRLLFKPDSGWKGCVYARYKDDADTTNDADDDLGYVDDKGWKGWEPRIYNGKTCGWSCTPCLEHGITPLNQSKTQTLAAIDRLQTPTGNTDLPQGPVLGVAGADEHRALHRRHRRRSQARADPGRRPAHRRRQLRRYRRRLQGGVGRLLLVLDPEDERARHPDRQQDEGAGHLDLHDPVRLQRRHRRGHAQSGRVGNGRALLQLCARPGRLAADLPANRQFAVGPAPVEIGEPPHTVLEAPDTTVSGAFSFRARRQKPRRVATGYVFYVFYCALFIKFLRI